MTMELKNVMAYLLKHHPEKLSNTRLNNVVYLCDWYHAVEHGNQITDIEWCLSKFAGYGAYTRDIETAAENCQDLFRITHGEDDSRHFSLKDDGVQPHLDDETKRTLDLVIGKTKSLSWAEFLERVNDSYPVSSSSGPGEQINLVELAKEWKRR